MCIRDRVKKEDYEIKQNAREATVDISMKVKEKGRNSIGFSGGVSGLAGNFVGFNYATNNFLGLGETLSVQMQWGTYEKLYSFGFTEPYLFDRAITTGFTVFKSDFRYDQLRQAAYYSGINPEALEQTVRYASRVSGRPVIVTENGIATEDDARRGEYIRRALQGLARCLADGLDVRGYFYWSAMDNFEWVFGYRPKFGLIAVDRQNFTRSVRPSARYLGRIARTGGIPPA